MTIMSATVPSTGGGKLRCSATTRNQRCHFHFVCCLFVITALEKINFRVTRMEFFFCTVITFLKKVQ